MRLAFTAALATAVLFQGTPAPSAGDTPRIYSADPADSWNRLFAALLTRNVRTRYTSEFPDRGPFQAAVPDQFMFAFPAPSLSTRVFDRREEGDRAIDALYPAFLVHKGPRDALLEPLHGELTAALTAALHDGRPRSTLARALMQADLWSAYDLLRAISSDRLDPKSKAASADLTGLIARLVARLALTREEIGALPDNYSHARRSMMLPDLFGLDSDWLEVVWAPFHVHEDESQKRRATRVLMRPSRRPENVAAFLAAATKAYPQKSFAAVALVEQMMLVDRSGHVVPAPLTRDVQLRAFTWSASGTLQSTTVTEFELSRRKILSDRSSGGFVRFDASAEAYLATGGNDYGFASPVLPSRSEPAVSTLRARCSGCHGPDGTNIVSFSVHDPDQLPAPRALSQPNDERTRAVAAAKEARDDFKRLIEAAGLRR